MMSTTLTTISFLFADVGTTPTSLEFLTEVDVLHTAFWLQIRLGYFHDFAATFPTPVHEPFPHDPEFATF